jgi:homoserine acetyltransferase
MLPLSPHSRNLSLVSLTLDAGGVCADARIAYERAGERR